ncbi:tetratricopeptide repeat protein [Ornithinimicrobium sufpigmenti]|uniref:tetratricopeptide repeat protein n=1 Tax=Ornithinimicrobium sufpigmenti TaxID=2508882 RepID=UPI0015E18467|nr:MULTISPECIES: tetratricopeptide repeat protein [unclassified Ornithinimicrobium]
MSTPAPSEHPIELHKEEAPTARPDYDITDQEHERVLASHKAEISTAEAVNARPGAEEVPSAKASGFAQQASAYVKSGELELAERVLVGGLALHPDSSVLRGRLLGVRVAAQDWAGAIAVGQPLVDERGSAPQTSWFAQLATAYVKSGDLESAEKVIQRGLEAHRDSPVLRGRLLGVRVAAQDWDGAVSVGMPLLAEGGPTLKASLYAQLATAYVKSGDLRSAESVVERGLTMFPDDVVLRGRLLAVRVAARDWAGAMAVGERLLAEQASSSQPSWFAQLATAYAKSGDTETAASVLERGIATHPDAPALRGQLLGLRVAARDWTGAVAVGSLLVSEEGENAKASWYAQLATAHAQSGDLESAASVLERGLAAHSDAYALRGQLLGVRVAARDWVAAVAVGEPLIAEAKAEVRAAWLGHLATAHFKTGRPELASRLLDEPSARGSEDPSIKFARALISGRLNPDGVDYVNLGVLKLSREQRQDLSAVMPEYDFGSCTPGISAWATKWAQADHSRRVLMIAPKDFSGSMYKLAEAVNRHSDYAVRLITFHPHPFGYPDDLVVPEVTPARLRSLLKQVETASVLHLKDEHSWFNNAQGINTELLHSLFFGEFRSHHRTVFTTYGGWARSHKDNQDWRAAVSSFDARAAMTPDLNFDWYKGVLLPHAIDTEMVGYAWTDSNILAHSSSTVKPIRKGTDLLFEAVSLLEQRGTAAWSKWGVDFISGVSHASAMARTQAASLYFDQAGREGISSPLSVDDVVGWYGNAAVEALAAGIPVLVHIREDAAHRAVDAGINVDDWPILTVHRDPGHIAARIEQFISATSAERREISERSREYASAVHGYGALAGRLRALYDSLTLSPQSSAESAGTRLDGSEK